MPPNNALIACLNNYMFIYIQGYSFSHMYSASSITWFRVAQIQCFHRITIAKITCTICNFKNLVIGGWLRLPDYTQYKTRFCDEVIFQLWSTRYALKMIQINKGKPNKFETKFETYLNNPQLSNLWSDCDEFMISRVKSVKPKTLPSPIMIEPVHL